VWLNNTLPRCNKSLVGFLEKVILRFSKNLSSFFLVKIIGHHKSFFKNTNDDFLHHVMSSRVSFAIFVLTFNFNFGAPYFDEALPLGPHPTHKNC
jgi:hypothetical protein